MLKIAGFLTRLMLNCGLLLLTTSTVYAQTISATLEGRVTDSSGAAVPEAVVTVVNTATGASRSGGRRPGLLAPAAAPIRVNIDLRFSRRASTR